MSNICKAYELAKEQYAAIGVDVDKAIDLVDRLPLSIHCWQGDDVGGMENEGGELTGGIQATGNYPGKARNIDELRADIDKAFSLIPGEKKINIHASYLENGGKKIDRNQIEPEHFAGWADWAVANKVGVDFNPTYFSHPLSENGFTLSCADESIRSFWIEHGVRCRVVSEYLGKKTGKLSINNVWIPDGEKEVPIDTLGPRMRLLDSLNQIAAKTHIDPACSQDAFESKLFGIGSEAYVTGSHEFYMGYTLSHPGTLLTLDVGHYHPTESVAAKISALMVFLPKILLHVSRPIRWDSDHVVAYNDELRDIMGEVVRNGLLDRVYLSLDYFDASINRIMAWVIGARNARKALLEALLWPVDTLKAAEAQGDKSTRLAFTQELKSYPFGTVWDYYCQKSNMPVGIDWIGDVKQYEKDVLSKR